MRWYAVLLATLALSIASIGHPAPPLRATALPPPASPPVQPVAAARRATLVFTATSLSKGYGGANVGTGALRVYEPSRDCATPPNALIKTQEVTVDQPEVLLTIPAGRPLVLASFWNAGGAHCVVGNYDFIPQAGASYVLTNVQNISSGTCRLRLKRLADDGRRYVPDHSLRRSRRGCVSARRDG